MRVKLTLAANFVFVSAAFAQSSTGQAPITSSSVTLFGIVDAAVTYGTGSDASKTQLSSGAYQPSRFGFRGNEALGGGLGINFWLEAGFNVDDGGGVAGNSNNTPAGATSGDFISFNRRATVSVIDIWGEVRLGRDFTAIYRNREQVDPFGTNGVGASQPHVGTLGGPTATRASNMVGYFLPPGLGGFFGEVQYFMGENISYSPSTIANPNLKDGNGYAARIGYGIGGFAVAVSSAETKFARSDTTGDINSVNVGASYDFGFLKLSGGYYREKVDRIVPVTGTGYLVGGSIPVGVDQVRLSYSTYGTDEVGSPRSRKFAIGYVYNFSKRTAVYATYAHLDNSGGASGALAGSLTAPDRSSNGYDLGLRHSF
ncbi:porin [Variovorax rhizosphaerae]|uniref:Porin n=1 Tax=Variovorax rhizosphaerae TaxID=1836200 RepID=A0ABU8WYS7_9BURK